MIVAAFLGMPALAKRLEAQPAPLVAGDIRLVGLEPGRGGIVEHQVDVQLEEIHATPKDLLLDGIAVLGEQVERSIKLAQGQIPRLGQPDPLQPPLVAGQLRARPLQPLHGHCQECGEMRRLQLLLGDPGCDRRSDPEPLPQGLDHMHDPELEHRLDLDVTSARALDHRCALLLGQNPPNTRHQPLQHRPVEPLGPAEAVHHPGLDMALLGVPGILGERVVAHHAAVLVTPLGRPKIHAHSDSMSIMPNRARTGNSCAHMFGRRNGLAPKAEPRNFNDLPSRRRPNPPQICPTTANSGLAANRDPGHRPSAPGRLGQRHRLSKRRSRRYRPSPCDAVATAKGPALSPWHPARRRSH